MPGVVTLPGPYPYGLCLVSTYGNYALKVCNHVLHNESEFKPDKFPPSRGFFIVSSNVYPAMPGVVALPGPYPYGPLLSVHLWHLGIKVCNHVLHNKT